MSGDRYAPFLLGCFVGAILGALWFALFTHLFGWGAAA